MAAATVSGSRSRLRQVPSLLRRVLDVRLAEVVGQIDLRLGSRANTRPPIHDRLDDLDRWARETLAAVGELSAGRGVAELRPEVAEFLNWATGPEGYAAQAGLWFNPPVPVRHYTRAACKSKLCALYFCRSQQPRMHLTRLL